MKKLHKQPSKFGIDDLVKMETRLFVNEFESIIMLFKKLHVHLMITQVENKISYWRKD